MEQILPLEHASLTLITEGTMEAAQQDCLDGVLVHWMQEESRKESGLQKAKLTKDW